MTDTSDPFDRAARLAEQEREAGIARAQSALHGYSDRQECDCGSPIGEERRRAMPNAKECIDCATRRERGQ